MFYQKIQNESDRLAAKWIERIVLSVLIAVLLVFSFSIISPGERGVVIRLGAINRVMDEGFHFNIPLLEKVKVVNIQTQKEQVEAMSASKDLQMVTTTVALNYHLDAASVGLLWQEIGKDYKEKLIDPAIQEAVKASTAKFTAEQLVTQRSEVRDEIKKNITERLGADYITVTEISIVNFGFSQAFDEAIENKVTAEQNALAAKNQLEQVKFEAEQRIEKARAEAEAIRIQAEAIQNQGGAEYVQLQAIDAWNGQLPTYMMDGAMPFINIK